MTRSSRRAGAAALLVACLLALAGCGSGDYVGSGVWSNKPEAQKPQGQTPEPPKQPEQPQDDPEDPAGDPYIRATGLDQPYAIVGMPDGTALVGERATGNVTRVFAQPGIPQQFVYQIPGIAGGGALLALALPPNYFETGLIYAYVSTTTDNRVVSVNAAGVTDTIFTGIPKGAARNGSAMTVAMDGTIVIATGDTGDSKLVSNMNSLAGKILLIDQFGDPVAGGSPIVRAGFSDPTGICMNADGVLFVVDAGNGSTDGNALYAVGADDSLSGPQPLVEYAGTTAGAADCVAGGVSVIVTGLDSQSLMTTQLDTTGAPVDEPTLSLTGEYGRLRTISLDPINPGMWVSTSNRDGVGTPAADDDKILYVPLPAGGGAGDVS